MHAIIVASSLGFLALPVTQGIMSKQVGADEQGALQGALTSLTSLTAVVGPILATSLFSRFTAPTAVVTLPGAPFFSGATPPLGRAVAGARYLPAQPRYSASAGRRASGGVRWQQGSLTSRSCRWPGSRLRAACHAGGQHGELVNTRIPLCFSRTTSTNSSATQLCQPAQNVS
jgi:hypothetical protein